MGNSSSTKSLPYTILSTQCQPTSSTSYWEIKSGETKSDKSPVSVFILHKPSLINKGVPAVPEGEIFFHAASHHFSKIKTLVHPNILRALATLDTDDTSGTGVKTGSTTGDFVIVTEPVIPLAQYLNENSLSGDQIAWGLHCLINALQFLHGTAKLAHGRVCVDSVYVTPSGDFKLGDLSLLTPVGVNAGPTDHFRECQASLCPFEYRGQERMERRWDLVEALGPHAMDSYGLGVLIENIYEGHVPQKLIKALGRLKTDNVKARPRLGPLLKCPIFDIPLVKSLGFLDGIAAKPAEEKISYLQSLPDQFNRGVISGIVAQYKLLPELERMITNITSNPQNLTQDIGRREILATVPPLFFIIEHVTSTEGEGPMLNTILPLIVTLFTINDRAVRGSLLSRISPLAAFIPSKILNSSVFEPICSGFTDSSAPLRELTLKTMIGLVPHLNPNSLEKLVRYLVRLQGDTEASIRTNTMIFIGKVVHDLDTDKRQRLILPAFERAMKDDFTPCRLAALKAVLVSKDYFDPGSLAQRVLPLVIPHLMDSCSQVREDAFRVVDDFVEILRQECQRRERADEDGFGNDFVPEEAPTSSGGYLSGFGSWAVGGRVGSTKGEIEEKVLPGETVSASPSPNVGFNTPIATTDDADDDGWSDEEVDVSDENGTNDNKFGNNFKNKPSFTDSTVSNNSNDDFFAALDKAPSTFVGSVGSVNKLSGKGKLVMPPPAGGLKKQTLAERKADFEKRKAERQAKLKQLKQNGK